MARYDRDYSVTEIKTMIAISERKPHPYNPGNVGHAFRDHHGISDSDLIAKNKSAFIISQQTNATGTYLDPAMIGQTWRMKIRTVSDQPFVVAKILNSSFGQAALKLLNVAMGARMTIHANPVSGPGGNFNIRVKSGGAVDASGQVKHVVLVVDNGGRDSGKDYLHFVTAYPTNGADYKFKFGPQVPRTRPGVEFYTENGRKSLYLWSSDNQEADGQLNLLLLA
ncbi:hypothetical protein [Acidocella facilis]|uniref:hypothetical protein n=1 Tax=Acidocella facilis TaxID=525 RepID=UPI000478E813|nr:hypothetical protein [Acidocella facilis]